MIKGPIQEDTTIINIYAPNKGFPHSSVCKESACNGRDPDLIPEAGRSSREGIGYPLQYSWASSVAQLVTNPSAMQETWVQSLDWEDPLEKGKAYPFQYSGLENSMDCIIHGVAKSQTRMSDFHFHFHTPNIGVPQYTRQMLTSLKGETNSNTIIVGKFSTPLTSMDRSTKQKIGK